MESAMAEGSCGFTKIAPSPQSYCVGVVNSRGCLPVIAGSGSPSASSPNPFWITGTNVISNRTGILLFGTRPDRTPFQGGTLCLGLPFRRGGTLNSGGNLTGPDCSGVLQRDFNLSRFGKSRHIIVKLAVIRPSALVNGAKSIQAR